MERCQIENSETFQKVLLVLDYPIEIAYKINVAESTVSNWIRGVRRPSSDCLEKLYYTYKGKKIRHNIQEITIESPEDMGLKFVSVEENTLGKRLKSLLKQKNNMSQVKFAELMGVDKGHISNIINGNKEPSFNLIKDICSYFNISIDFLTYGIINTSNDLLLSWKLSEKSISNLNYWLNPPQLFKFTTNSVDDINEIDVLNFLIENNDLIETYTRQLKESCYLYLKMEKEKNLNMKIAREKQEQILQLVLDNVKQSFRNMIKEELQKYNKIDITKIM